VAREQEDKPEERREKAGVKVYMYYSIEGGRLVRKRSFCPKCGVGFFMAEHKDRRVCGHCGLTVPKPEGG